MTLYRRESGNYGWEARDRRLPGGRMSISLRTKDRKEAQRRERALDFLLERGETDVLQRLRSGDLHVSQVTDAVKNEAIDALRGAESLDLSLGAMVDRVTTAKEATRRQGTAEVYQTYTTSMLERWGRERSILNITSDEMRTWLYEEKARQSRPHGGGRTNAVPAPWSANTQAKALMVAGYVWRLAIALELEHAERIKAKPRITRDPWAGIEIGKARPRVAFLEPHEWADLLAAVQGEPEAAMLALCCLGGLRIQEALHLRTGLDVDLTENVLRIQARAGEYAWQPKGENSNRTIPMPGALRAILREHIEADYAGERYFIRLADHDRPINYSTARKWAKAAFKKAGLKYGREADGLTIHSLRHSCATWLIREGWSSSLIAKYLGNDSKQVDTVYGHLRHDDLNKMMATLDGIGVTT